MNKHIFAMFLVLILMGLACSLPNRSEAVRTTATQSATITALASAKPLPGAPMDSPTVTPQPTTTPPPSETPTVSASPTASRTPTASQTPTPSLTATETSTATYAFPQATVNKQAHCRYGPAKAYLHAADLYAGDTGTVRGRFAYSNWLYIKFDKLDYFCWAAPSVVDVVGDISLIYLTEPKLPGPSALYRAPDNVSAVRDGDQVTITWGQVRMTEDDDRGYFISAWVCQDGHYLWWTMSFPDQYTNTYTVSDQKGCPLPSSGKLYTVEKHGYSEPAAILWP